MRGLRKRKIDVWESKGVMPGLSVALYHDRKRLVRDLNSRGVTDLNLSDAPAQTFPEKVGGETIHFVLMLPSDRPLWAQLALLAHEAHHIAQRYFEELGEERPGEEAFAYATQAAAGCLFDAHLRWCGKGEVK